MTADELIAFNDQIASMAKAGLPLDQGLAGMSREMGFGRLRSVTAAIARDLEAGMPLPDAIERRRGELPPYYANLVMAGIRTGRLPDVLATLTNYARSMSATRAIVVEALLYPAVVISLAAILFGGLIFLILPQFSAIFKDFNMSLPGLTQAVFSVGRHPWPILAVALALLAGLPLTWAILQTTPQGKQRWARLVYSIPVVGTLVRSARLAAFAELLSVLVEHELPLPEAFRMAGEASSDPLMAGRTWAIYARLNQGMSLATAVRGQGFLPEWVAWMVGAGEMRGTLAAALRQIAVVYRRQVEVRSGLLRSVLPAFAIVTTAAGLVAIFALSVMLPLVKLLEGLSK